MRFLDTHIDDGKNIIENKKEEDIKKNNSSLLNKKRTSDASDMSFNRLSNENEFGNYNSSNNIILFNNFILNFIKNTLFIIIFN